jgi:hypothetical protein
MLNNLSQRFQVRCKTAGSERVTERSFGNEEHYLKLIKLETFKVFKSDKIMQGDLLHQFRTEVHFKELFSPHIAK